MTERDRTDSPNPTSRRTPKSAPSKADTALLEPFVGLASDRIFCPASPEQYAAALAAIRAAGAVGFDTETKPVFVRGVVNQGPDIVQVATTSQAFIFQLGRIECRAFLQEILQAEDILKIGFDLKSDRELLHRKLGVVMKSVIDLTTVFRQLGYRNTTGVRSAVGIVLQRSFRKSKHVTTSNWSLAQLAPNQLHYAANDAYAPLMIWIALGRPDPQKLSRHR
jgi:ribonuclease D